jgi:hypothetical protein
MSEEQAPYGVAYTVEPPKSELKVGDRVQVIDTDIHRCEYMGYKGTVVENPNPANGCVRVALGGYGLSADFRPEWLSKLAAPVPKNPVNPNVVRFQAIVNEMVGTYEAKNATYGDSFSISVRKYGLISALTRISDKFNRLENLLLGAKNEVPDESVYDTLKDLACYCVMTVMAIKDNDFENVE